MQLFPALFDAGRRDTMIGQSVSTNTRQGSALFDGVLENELQAATYDMALSLMGSTVSTDSGSPSALDVSTSSILTERVTQEDFAGLRSDLRDAGLSEEALVALDEKVNSEEGMTWQELIEDVREAAGGGKDKANLSDEDKRQILSLFDKLGFTPDEAQKLLTKLENGEHKAVFMAVADKIGSLPSDLSMTFSADEAEAFGRALELSGDSMKRLTSLFREISGLDVTPEGMQKALLVIKGELQDKNIELDKSLGQFGERIAEAMEAAKARKSNQANSNNREDGVNHKVGAMTTENTDASKVAQTQKNGEQGQHPNGKDKNGDSLFKQNQDAQLAAAQGKEGSENADGEVLSQFMSKIRLDGSVRTQDISGLGNGTTLSNFSSSLKNGVQAGRSDALLQARVLRQVETGMLKSLSQGVKQLSVNLSPEEYGNLNIVLQAKNKEVQATIRADSPEAAKVISENLHHLKQTLEQQGLKVAKLEVQTGLPQDTSSSWQGSQQHNQAREQRELMDRLRTSRKLLLGASGNVGVVQNMQGESEMAKVSQSGLDLFA